MNTDSIKKKSANSTYWSLLDNLATQGLGFVIGIVLARILSPTDFGTVGVLAIFIAISNVFVEGGFGTALIRKKDRTEEDLSTAFHLNVGIGLVTYLLLFLSAPLVATFFRISELCIILRILGISVIFNSFTIVQNSILIANFEIKKLAIVNFLSQLPAGLMGIYFAYKGYGVWTLVIQQVGAGVLKTIILWYLSQWRPTFIIKKESLAYLFHFGWKLVSANLIGAIFNEIYSFIIGRQMGPKDLGYFSKSKQLMNQPLNILKNIIMRVALPIMVESCDNKNRTKEVYSSMMQLLCFVSFGGMYLLIVIAKPLICLMWTEKWIDSVLIFQILCFGHAWAPVSTINLSLLQLLNRTDMTLKLELYKKPFCILLLIIGLRYGVIGVALSATFYNFVAAWVNMRASKKLLDYSYGQQNWDIIKYMLVAIFSSVISMYLVNLSENYCYGIVVGCVSMLTIYLALCTFFKFTAVDALFVTIKQFIKK